MAIKIKLKQQKLNNECNQTMRNSNSNRNFNKLQQYSSRITVMAQSTTKTGELTEINKIQSGGNFTTEKTPNNFARDLMLRKVMRTNTWP